MRVAELPALLDRKQARTLLGLTEVDVERVFDACEIRRIPGSRKAYVVTESALAMLQPLPGPRRVA